MDSVAAIVLAAGMGTRMRSRLAKVLHPLGGRPMLEHVVLSLQQAGVSRVVVVVGHQADEVMEEIEADVEYVVQEEQLGTAHAVMQAREKLAGHPGPILVTCGDTPLYKPQTFRRILEAHRSEAAEATLVAAILDDPSGYGRVIRDPASGEFVRIVEERDIQTAEEASVREVNAGTYCFEGPALFGALDEVGNDNAQREYYLPDALAVVRRRGGKVAVYRLDDPLEAMGVNDRRQLAAAEHALRMRVLEELMQRGVTIVDPRTTYIHSTVRVGQDTTIYPFTILEGETTIGEGCEIGPHAQVRDCVIGDEVVIDTAVVVGCRIGDGATIGPYAYLRSGAVVEPGAKGEAFRGEKE